MKNRDIIAICDEESEYCYLLDSYLRANLNLPFEIFDFTNVESLLEFEKKQDIAVLIISASAYKEIGESICSNVLLLQDDEMLEQYVAEEDNTIYISKYVSSKVILNSLLEVCMEMPGNIGGGTKNYGKIEMIGTYTPLDKNAQMAIAMEIAALMAEKEKTLFIDLEPFSCMELYCGESYHETIADLMYYLECNPDKFLLYFDRICQDYKKLKVIPPAVAPTFLQTISKKQWEKLIKEICDKTDIKKIVINMSELVDGLYEFLSECGKVYTVVNDDAISQNVLHQYEALLKENEYEKIIAITKNISKPLYIQQGELNSAAYGRWAQEIMEQRL